MSSKRQRTAALMMEKPDATSGAREPATKTALPLTKRELEEYHREGFVIKRALFSAEEAAAVLSCAQSDSAVLDRAHGRKDSDGFVSKLSLWNTCGVNMYGALARSARVVDGVEQILGGSSHGGSGEEECYHYHTKVIALPTPFRAQYPTPRPPRTAGDDQGGARGRQVGVAPRLRSAMPRFPPRNAAGPHPRPHSSSPSRGQVTGTPTAASRPRCSA